MWLQIALVTHLLRVPTHIYPPGLLAAADARMDTTDCKQLAKYYSIIIVRICTRVTFSTSSARSHKKLTITISKKQTGDTLTYQRLKAFHGRSLIDLLRLPLDSTSSDDFLSR